jgi:hypothetical protein
MRRSIWTPILVGTLVCGTLDILFAIVLTLLRGKEPAAMLRTVASGPFPDASHWGAGGALLGLAVHYALMAVMISVLVVLILRRPQLLDTPWRTALAYGVLTYFVMNWAVVPLRFHTPLPPGLLPFTTQVFAHVVLVGVPATFIARRDMRG